MSAPEDARFRVAPLDAIPFGPPSGHPEGEWRPVRHHLGIASFGINAYRAAQAGDPIIGEHDHAEPDDPPHEELYLVVSGRARFVVDGEPVDAPAGTLVFVRALDAMRSATALAPDTEVLVIGAAPGRAFEVSAWERERLQAGGAPGRP